MEFKKLEEDKARLENKKIQTIEDKEKLEDLESKILNYYEKCRGAQIRARIRWKEEGERCNKFFLGMEKHTQKKNKITEIKTTSGRVTKTEDILREIGKFYRDLYSAKK